MKSDAFRWYLQLSLDSFRIAGGIFFVICPKIACLFNIQSKLSLVEIGSEVMLIWITEKTAKYYFAGWLTVHNRLSTKDQML